jgi:hypothetical protein
MAVTRKQFLRLSVVFGAAACTGLGGAILGGCDSDDPPAPPGGGTGGGGDAQADAGTSTGSSDAQTSADTGPDEARCRSSLSDNHGHKLELPIEDLESDGPKAYSIRGTSDHDHEITLDASSFADLKLGNTVQVRSTDSYGHDHLVSILCS